MAFSLCNSCPSLLRRLTDKKKEAIVQAAVQEFRRLGYDATSMDAIAASAGVSKRTVYNHFPGKEDLFAAILQRLWETVMVNDRFDFIAPQTLASQLRQYLQQKIALFSDPAFVDLLRVIVAATIHAPERARGMVEQLKQSEPVIVRWIRDAQASGRLLAEYEPVELGDLLMGQVKAVALWPQIMMGQPPLDELRRQRLAEMAIRQFLGTFSQQPDAELQGLCGDTLKKP